MIFTLKIGLIFVADAKLDVFPKYSTLFHVATHIAKLHGALRIDRKVCISWFLYLLWRTAKYTLLLAMRAAILNIFLIPLLQTRSYWF